MTLSFREYLTFHDLQANDPTLNRKEEFQKYLRMGGFPAIHTADYGYEAIYKLSTTSILLSFFVIPCRSIAFVT